MKYPVLGVLFQSFFWRVLGLVFLCQPLVCYIEAISLEGLISLGHQGLHFVPLGLHILSCIYQKFKIKHTVCPRSLGPFIIVHYKINGARFLGYTVYTIHY